MSAERNELALHRELNQSLDEEFTPEKVARIGPDPEDLAFAQGADALDWLALARSGVGLRWPWANLDALLGPMMPGWLFALGARPKCGKTTLLLTLASYWAQTGRRVMVIPTETGPNILRVQVAALALGLPVGDAVTGQLGSEDHERLVKEITRAAKDTDGIMFGDTASGRKVEDIVYWLDYGADHGAQVVLFDHLHELDLTKGRDHTNDLAAAVDRLKEVTVERQVILGIAAQFNRGKGDTLALHEVPDETMWRGTDKIQQAAVVALQLWKPFARGVTPELKRAFREQRSLQDGGEPPSITDLVATDTMGIRVAAHRYRPKSSGELTKLRIRDDVIDEFPTWGMGS